MNYAVLIMRDFSLQAMRRAHAHLAGKPIALTRGEGRKACITEFSPEAIHVEHGLAVTLATARCPGLVILTPDPDAEAELHRLLLASAFTLSPRVEKTRDGCYTIDLRGANELRTETRMRACVAELTAVGLCVHCGAADTPLLAFYAAQRTDSVLVVRAARQFLEALPLDLAEPTPAHAIVLRGWGITTLGALTAIPKAEIGQRLGTDGAQLWERAAGETIRVLRLVEPTKTFACEWAYDPPVESMEPLLFRLRRFAECVALELRAATVVAEKLTLTLHLENETDYQREFRLPEPSADVDGWIRVLHGHLETVRTPARVTGVSLSASPARPVEKQDGLFETGLRDPVIFWENLARLGALVGDDRVGTPVLRDTWKPDAVTMDRPTETVPIAEPEPVHPARGLTLRRFRPAWPVRVHFEGHIPKAIDGDTLHVTVRTARGPFRLDGDWWRPAETWTAEVWQAEADNSAIYQLSRNESGWWVEGVLD